MSCHYSFSHTHSVVYLGGMAKNREKWTNGTLCHKERIYENFESLIIKIDMTTLMVTQTILMTPDEQYR